jgi:hypothetical protein
MPAKVGGWIIEWSEASEVAKSLRKDVNASRFQPDDPAPILSVIYKQIDDDQPTDKHFFPELYDFGGRSVMSLVTRTGLPDTEDWDARPEDIVSRDDFRKRYNFPTRKNDIWVYTSYVNLEMTLGDGGSEYGRHTSS